MRGNPGYRNGFCICLWGKGQQISEKCFLVFKYYKNQQFILLISTLASKKWLNYKQTLYYTNETIQHIKQFFILLIPLLCID